LLKKFNEEIEEKKRKRKEMRKREGTSLFIHEEMKLHESGQFFWQTEIIFHSFYLSLIHKIKR